MYLHLYPHIEAAIPLALRRFLAPKLPHKGFQRLRNVVSTMHEHAIHIYGSKKAALAKGDDGAKELFCEGKDLLSIMCAYLSFSAKPTVSWRTHSCAVRANIAADDTDRLSDEELIGQMS